MRNIIIILLAVGAVVGKHEIYKGNQVFNLEFEFETQLNHFRTYEQVNQLDVWSEAVLGKRNASVMVTPEQKEDFTVFLNKLGVEYTLEVNDVAEHLQKQDDELTLWRSQRTGRLVPFLDYPRYDDVDRYMVDLAAQYPSLVTLVSAGNSWEGRDIKYVRISSSNFTNTSKPIIFIDAMIHAREWVATPVAIHAMYRLVENLLTEDQDLIDDIDWIILPLANPDGYEYTHTDARLWRKTRSDNHTGADACPGIDGNRNFDFDFATIGVSISPCGETYPGTHAFSEPETAIMRDILLGDLARIQTYLTIHSHGNYVLFGYGNTNIPTNGIALHHVAAAMGTVMDTFKLPEADFYLVGNSALVLYGTSGSSQDYAQSIGVPFSYTLELPGFGNGFLVPPQYIEHVNMETWEGIKTVARLSVLYYRARTST